ncbi:MAG: lipoprotein [Bacteroidetes bacterium]|nr:lipoprotein [Bacteroidota bacterium]MCB9226225.1 lipoprotein [Chitinophagales bacterium]
MKKIAIILILLVALLSSCSTQKDCRGSVKHKLPNGIWM